MFKITTAVHLQCESKSLHLRFSGSISQTSDNFKINFTRLLHVHIYAKLQNFIEFPLTLTNCHTKRDHLVNVLGQCLHFTSRTRKIAISPQHMTDLHNIWHYDAERVPQVHP